MEKKNSMNLFTGCISLSEKKTDVDVFTGSWEVRALLRGTAAVTLRDRLLPCISLLYTPRAQPHSVTLRAQ